MENFTDTLLILAITESGMHQIFIHAAFLAQANQVVRRRLALQMEDGEFYDKEEDVGFHSMETEDHRPKQWRWQRTEESYVVPAQNVRPTDTMGTMLNVEELMTLEEKNRCCGQKLGMGLGKMSICGQVNWNICEDRECYGCYFKTNAIADMCTNNIKGDTTMAIGEWACKKEWANSSTLEQIEHIAIFLATRPKERQDLSRFGAVRLTREEGRTIIRDKKKYFNFFATVNIKRIIYLDDIATVVNESGGAEPSTFEFFL